MSNDLVKFEQLQADITQLVSPIKDMVVSDKESCDAATETLRAVKRLEKRIEDRRKELVGPLNDQVGTINDFAKKIKGPLSSAELLVKDRLLGYERKLAFEREEAQKREMEERRKREAEAAALAEKQREDAEAMSMFAESDEEAAATKARADAEAVRINFEAQKEHRDTVKEIAQNKVRGTQIVWVFDIDDPAKVPDEYKIVDEKKVRAAIAAGVRTISGITIRQETRITAR